MFRGQERSNRTNEKDGCEMIDWIKVENARKVKVTLKDGSFVIGSGEGLTTADDYDDEEYQYDTFSIGLAGGGVALPVDEIESVEIYE